ncbi:hypothetical protein WDZ16_03835 [Pseudokineococcus marinus]|uniref:Chain length determinant protein n=1 Tax=Pseudokineococcus marinus TaxID=351215 RepID=A0A849BKS5_9ACTN|nr:hypothetical protein [Pseudokineococcus marinus]NNH21903.1 hypothetical protein [Pseudokineococcus marinus]
MSSTKPSTGPSEVPVEVVTVDREPVSPLTALRRHWVVGAVLTIAGALTGAALGAATPASFTSESRVAVGSNDLLALSVPGYAYAAGQLAASTARYVDNSQALGALEPVLGEDAAEVEDVSASPIPESNIIRVEVTAATSDVATRATAAVTDYLLEQSSRVNTSSDADELLGQYADLSREVAQTRAERDSLSASIQSAPATAPPSPDVQAQLVDLEAQLAVLSARQGALEARYQDAVTSDDLSYQLVTVAEAAPSFDTSTTQVQRYGLVGLVAGLLLGLLAAVLLDRARRRPRPAGVVTDEPGGVDSLLETDRSGDGRTTVAETRARDRS